MTSTSAATQTETATQASGARRPRLLVIVGSIRPGRQGDRWGRWMVDVAREQGIYEPELVDLKEVGLPLMDEPNHPRLRQYQHDHTKKWSALVDGADAYVFVTPEYNYSFPASLKNALDYLFQEWKDKPAGIVSYGGISAGLRSAHQLRQVLAALGLAVPQSSVAIPFSQQHLTEDGGVDAPESAKASALSLLSEMQRLGALLRPQGNSQD